MPRQHRPKTEHASLAITGRAVLSIAAAAEGKPARRRFEIVAYTGEPLEQSWWDAPVVVDMDGIVADDVLPILDNHYAGREAVVGQSETAAVEDGRFVLRGFMILGEDTPERRDPARDICDKADQGFKWQASIGARCEQKDFVAEGNQVQVNGRTYDGPVYVSRRTVVREVSFVVIGADAQTSVVVATGSTAMPTFADWIKALGLDESKLTPELRARYEQIFAMEKKCKAKDDGEDEDDEDDEEDYDPEDEDEDDDDKPPAKKAKAKGYKAKASGRPRRRRNGDVLAAYREEAAAELRRHREVREVLAAYPGATVKDQDGKPVPALEHAILAGWGVIQLKAALLDHVREERPTVPITWYSPSQPELSEAVIEAAILNAGNSKLTDDEFYFSGHGDRRKRRVDFRTQQDTQQDLKARYTEKVQEAAHKMFRRGIALCQVLYACARLNGFNMREERITDGNLENVLRAAFTPRMDIRAEGVSTVSVQNVLANVLNKFLLEGYLYVDQSMFKISATRPVKDFKPTKSINVFGDFVYQKLNADGTIQAAAMTDEAFANFVDTFARMLSLSRKTIIDDDLSALTVVPRLMGIGAMDALNKLFWTVWLNGMGNGPDGAAFWASRNVAVNSLGGGALQSNNISGASSALSSASLQTAVYTFRKQVKPNAQPLGVEAEILLVPPELWATGRELVEAPLLVYGGAAAAKQPNKNVWEGQFELVESPFLSNSSYTGNSTTAWWILANPEMTATIDTAFLNGQRTPTVQTAQADFNTLGIMIRGFFDFGVAPMNTRAGVKSNGA
jgi:hypothetical protein